MFIHISHSFFWVVLSCCQHFSIDIIAFRISSTDNIFSWCHWPQSQLASCPLNHWFVRYCILTQSISLSVQAEKHSLIIGNWDRMVYILLSSSFNTFSFLCISLSAMVLEAFLQPFLSSKIVSVYLKCIVYDYS